MRNHDAIVIGTGQSGSALARRLVAAGQKVAVIERSAAHASIPDARPPGRSWRAPTQGRDAVDYGVTIRSALGVDM